MYGIITACMNRNENLDVAFSSWLDVPEISEINIVDWNSKDEVKTTLDKYLQKNEQLPSPKTIRISREATEQCWNLTQAFNIALRMCKTRYVIKLDADYILHPEFISKQTPIPSNSFLTGNWELAPNSNAQHLNGALFALRNDVVGVIGYNEYLTTYGYDDSDLYTRLELRGKTRLTLDFNYIFHIAHDHHLRHKYQPITDRLDIEIEKNRLLSNAVFWEGPMRKYKNITSTHIYPNTTYNLIKLSPALVTLDPQLIDELTVQARQNRNFRYALNIIVQNGIGNRIRSMCSAFVVARETGRPLNIIWESDFHCEALFSDLFVGFDNPPDGMKITVFDHLSDATKSRPKFDVGEECCDSPSVCPSTCHSVCPDSESDNEDVLDEADQTLDDMAARPLWIKTASVLPSHKTSWRKEAEVLKTLIIKPEIMYIIDTYLMGNPSYRFCDLIGVHIRMGQCEEYAPYESTVGWLEENKEKVQKWRQASHYQVFVNKMRSILVENPLQKFYLSADNKFIYDEIIGLFGDAIIYYPRSSFDRSIDQIKTAIIDVYLLANCKMLLSSHWSSFSELAVRWSKTIRQNLQAGIDF